MGWMASPVQDIIFRDPPLLSTNTIGVAVMIRRQWNLPSMQHTTLGTAISTTLDPMSLNG
jgi:hypothetical protein